MTNQRVRKWADSNLVLGQVFERQLVYDWFSVNYPLLKQKSIETDMVAMSVNAPSRIHHKVANRNGNYDLFWQIDSRTFRLWDPETDPSPIYADDDTNAIASRIQDVKDLHAGDELTNAELSAIFKVGNMGGMRRSSKTDTLVIVSDPFKGLYLDHWVGDVLHYTGMGKSEDQSLTFMQNKTLSESSTNGVGVHLFEVHKPAVYSYVGEVELVSNPYQDTQDGEDGKKRKVWIFPVAPKSGKTAPVSLADLRAEAEIHAKQARKLSDEELKAKATKTGKKKVGVRSAVTQQHQRNPWVTEYALRRAAGYCSLCIEPAPFKKKSGEPYLEVHHIVWLANDGEDTIENTVALCPNCHRKMHILPGADDIKFLQKIAEK